MTHRSRSEWTRLDLELYLDQALEPAVSNRLADSLRESPELRERLSNAAKLDALTRAALTAQHTAPRRRASPVRWTAVGVAAILAVALGVTMFFPRSAPTDIARNTSAAAPPPASMVVWSFPASREALPEPRPARLDERVAASSTTGDSHRPNAPSAPADVQFRRRLDAALARGDAAAAADLLATSDEALRVEGYRRLGAVLRSVSTARRVLEELPVGEQLAACRELAVEPRWRTVAATRLTSLHDDPANRAAVEALLSELARSPELAPLVDRIRARKPRSVRSESI